MNQWIDQGSIRRRDGSPRRNSMPFYELRQRLHSFQRVQAPDATVMTRLMKGYDDAQIEALAQWFARKEGQ